MIIQTSDRVDFPGILTPEQKRRIIHIGPCQPKGPFPVDKEGRNRGRGFDTSYYVGKTKSEKLPVEINRHWLSYSTKLNMCYCYCQPCWLFDSSASNQCLVKGTSDWAHLARNVERHETSQQHTISCEVYDRWEADKTIDAQQTNQLNDATNYWRSVLRRIFDVTLTLATNDLPFRDHRLRDDETTAKGNFLN